MGVAPSPRSRAKMLSRQCDGYCVVNRELDRWLARSLRHSGACRRLDCWLFLLAAERLALTSGKSPLGRSAHSCSLLPERTIAAASFGSAYGEPSSVDTVARERAWSLEHASHRARRRECIIKHTAPAV